MTPNVLAARCMYSSVRGSAGFVVVNTAPESRPDGSSFSNSSRFSSISR